MSGVIRRSIFACLLAAICFVVSPRPDAAQSSPVIARFVATAVSTDDPQAAAGRIEIFIERWSTDEQRESLRAAFRHG